MCLLFSEFYIFAAHLQAGCYTHLLYNMDTRKEKTSVYEEIEQDYNVKLYGTEKRIRQLDRKIGWLSMVRLLTFAVAMAALIYAIVSRFPPAYGLMAVGLLAFAAAATVQNRHIGRRKVLRTCRQMYESELKGLQGDYSDFEGCENAVPPSHPYAFDLDVFGAGSLFQCINRTATPLAQETLCKWFAHPYHHRQEIEMRQAAIRELSKSTRFCHDLRVCGLLFEGEPADYEEIRKWGNAPASTLLHTRLHSLPWIVLGINVAAFVAALAGLLPMSTCGILFVAFFLVTKAYERIVDKTQHDTARKLSILKTYAHQMEKIEAQEFTSGKLRAERNRLKDREGVPASAALHQLAKRIHTLDQRNNLLISFVLNGLMCWEVYQAARIERWRVSYGKLLPQWLSAVGIVEAYASLGLFAYHHPDYVYPEMSDTPGHLKAEALGHPLMDARRFVRNPICIEQAPAFLIVTGANMAGKSTYLRTVGVNYLLACLGAPVCADSMEIYPASLFTSLRTSDSLQRGESYFYAELKRLREIILRLEQGNELFIILDEILKGTNSIDKRKGSLALVKQFIRLHTTGIIATHDLELGSLIESFPEQIQNLCFEAEIQQQRLHFSYRLRQGIAHNMNACFLMRKMGIAMPDEELPEEEKTVQ